MTEPVESSGDGSIFRKWELRRIPYNIMLVLVTLGVAALSLLFGHYPHPPTAIKVLLFGVVIANALYCAGPVTEWYLSMLPVKRWIITSGLFISGTLLACMLTAFVVAGLLGAFSGRPFDREVWHAMTGDDRSDNPRAKMVADLEHRYIRSGITREQVIFLLGEPDYDSGEHDYDSSQRLLQYSLGMWSGFGIDYDSFDVHLDEQGRVTHIKVVQH